MMTDVQIAQARGYAYGRIDAAPPGMYVHSDRFVAAVEAEGTRSIHFAALYNRLIRETHGVRGLVKIGVNPTTVPCCDLHRPGSCCDLDDCGPCCEHCPDCLAVAR